MLIFPSSDILYSLFYPYHTSSSSPILLLSILQLSYITLPERVTSSLTIVPKVIASLFTRLYQPMYIFASLNFSQSVLVLFNNLLNTAWFVSHTQVQVP